MLKYSCIEFLEGEIYMYRLIVVDDEKIIRESIFSFEWNEINVMPVGCFDSGSSALEYIRQNPVDIVLTDICMPVMNGISFIEKLKAENENVIVICISGYCDYEYLRMCMRVGAKDYILKPIDKQELFDIVESTLQGKKEKVRVRHDIHQSESHSEGELNKHNHYVEEVLEYIEKHYKEHINLEIVAERVVLNPVYLSFLFKKVTGVKFSEYLNSYRIQQAIDLLEHSTLRIGEIAENVGYNDARYFSEMFKKKIGVTPNEYRSKREK